MFLVVSTALNAQKNGLALVQSFSPKEYKAETQNWAITQDHRGIMYFANSNGVLEFDGKNWRLIRLKHGKLVRSLATDNSGRVYVGGFGDFGILNPDPTGKLEYMSLLNDAQRKELNLKDVWKIIITEDNIYFGTPSKLIIWNKGNYKVILPTNRFHRFFYVDNKIYVRDKGKGIFFLDNDTFKLINESEIFADERIYAMQKFSKDKILIGTLTKGFYLYNTTTKNNVSRFSKFKTESDNYVKENSLYQSFKLDKGNFLFATSRGGAIEINNSGKEIRKIRKNKDLIDDNIRYIYQDKQKGLWMALNNGIARIELESPLEIWNDQNGLKGSVYDIFEENNSIYIGTSSGLFKIDNGEIKHIDNTIRPVWKLLKTPHKNKEASILVSYYNGIYLLNNDKLKLIHKSNVAYDLINSKKFTNRVYAGLSTEVIVLEYENNQWLYKGNIQGTKDYIIRYIIEEKNGNLWLATSDHGLLNVKVDESKDFKNYQVIKYDKQKGLKSNNSISLGTFKNEILFSSDSGVFIFDPDKDLFIEDKRFYGILDNKQRIGTITTDQNNRIWIDKNYGNSVSQVGYLIENKDHSFKWINTPLLRYSQSVTLDFYTGKNDMLWSGGSEGLVLYNSQKKSYHNSSFNTLIREVKILNKRKIFNGTFLGEKLKIGNKEINKVSLTQPNNFIPDIDYKNNSIQFSYSATSYDAYKETKYSYFLDGFDEIWSEWKEENFKEYTNLPAGFYTFNVKAKNIYNKDGKIASFSFNVLPAWYQTKTAIFFFIILSVFLIWVVIHLNTHRLNMINKSLEKKVVARTQEILEQNKILFQQKDEISSQRDKIEDSYNKLEEVLDELRLKNKEIFFQKQLIQDKSKKLSDAKQTINEQNKKLQKTNISLENDLIKRAKELEELNKNLSEINNELDLYIYRSAHDLRGPITRLLGLVNVAKMELKNETQTVNDYLRKFEKTGIEMRLMQSNLLLMHNINNHEIKFEFIDWEIIILKTLDKLSKIFDISEIEITSNIDEDIQFISDKFLVTILLEKLLENAIRFKKDFVSKSYIKIDVTPYNHAMMITIKDNGIGIQEDMADKVFDMFSVCNQNSKGAGLGLYISRIITEKLNGEIIYNIKNKKETEFIVKFRA